MITICFSVLHIISSEGMRALSAIPPGKNQKVERGVLKSVCSQLQVSEFVVSVRTFCHLITMQRGIIAFDLTESSGSQSMCVSQFLVKAYRLSKSDYSEQLYVCMDGHTDMWVI
jgi:hypothetical protein